MAVIANLDINIRGNPQGLDQAVDKAKGSMAKLRDDTDKHTDGIATKLGGLSSTILGKFSSLAGALSGTLGAAVSAISAGFTAAAGSVYEFIASLIAAESAADVATGGLTLLVQILAAAAAAAATVVTAFATLGFFSMDGVEKIGKLAGKLGMSTAAVAALQHEVTVAGGDVDAFNGSMEKFAKAVSKAGEGSPEINKALGELGLTAQDVYGKKLDEALMNVADRFQKLKNPTDQVRLATELFGKSGTAALGVLKSGAEGFKQAMEEAQRMGLALTDEQIGQVAEANRAWRDMKESIVGVGRTMAVAIAPFVRMFADLLKEFIQWINTYRDQIIRVFAFVAVAMKNLGLTWELVTDAMKYGFVTAMMSVVHFFTDTLPTAFKGFIKGAGVAFMNLFTNLKDNIAQLVEYIATMGEKGGNFVWKPLTEGWVKAWADVKATLTRAPTDWEQALLDKLRGTWGKLNTLVDAFIGRNVGKPRPEGMEEPFGGGAKAPGAVERGSEAAFAIIAGNQQDKMYAVANNTLQENKKMAKTLEKILRNLYGVPLVKARLAK